MAALPTGAGYQTRGTIGTAHDNTNDRVDYERMLGAILKDLRFFQPKYMVQKAIPRKNNELVRFSFRERATGAVYGIDEHGNQTAGTNSVGGAQTAGQPVPSIALNMRTKNATIKRYGSAYLWTANAESTAERELRPWGLSEMGIIIAEQMDALTKGMFDSYAQDFYPEDTVTTDTDPEFTASMVFNYALLVKIATRLEFEGLKAPGGGNFPMILPNDALANLMLDTTFATMLRESAVRRDPVAAPFDTRFVGSLCGFDFFTSNRLVPTATTTTNATPATFNIQRAYVYVQDAMGCLSMEDEKYGKLPNDSGNSSGNRAGQRDIDSNPQPVAPEFLDYGSGRLGYDMFGDHAGLVEKHTFGLTILNVGWLKRITFAQGTAGKIGIATATTGTIGHAGLDGSV